jgi:hypothetical protein
MALREPSLRAKRRRKKTSLHRGHGDRRGHREERLFSTIMHNFAQLFSTNFIDAELEQVYVAHRLNRKRKTLYGSG